MGPLRMTLGVLVGIGSAAIACAAAPVPGRQSIRNGAAAAHEECTRVQVGLDSIEARARAEMYRLGAKDKFKTEWVQPTGQLGYVVALTPDDERIHFGGGALIWVAKWNACVKFLTAVE